MALIDELQKICQRLAPLGWRDLLMKVTHNSLDIQQTSPAKLKAALTKPIANVDRTLPGFEDFDGNGRQGITPGRPSQSLLYHALASPCVTRDGTGAPLLEFATPTEIETVENAVFGLEPPKLASLVQAAGGKLAVVVFALEFRPAVDTPDRAHADLVFSRTGISRVGTARAKYLPDKRGFWPEDDNNPNAFRVIPARFTAWLAVSVTGDKARVMGKLANDKGHKFWVPVHKLFDGPECLDGLDLTLAPTAEFYNMKLLKVREFLTPNAKVSPKYPYVIKEGLADLVQHGEFGRMCVVPTVHEALVAPAIDENGKLATFKVPKLGERGKEEGRGFGALEPGSGKYPAYIHIRTMVKNGQLIDLNDEPELPKILDKGGYQALMYVDFTGEGWVDVKVSQLDSKPGIEAGSRPAYLLLGAPDFFPSAGQRELSEWANSEAVPASFRGKDKLWAVPPIPLSAIRHAANLQLPNSSFDPKEVTMTAVVGIGAIKAASGLIQRADVERASNLPDDGAGVFAPGWDASVDRKGNVTHLSIYGLGSPFPEDAKLCAALSTFWPAVAPDVYRTMPLRGGSARGTVAPLTDEEIGQVGTSPWDGVSGPRIVQVDGRSFVEIPAFLHVDYVRNAIENRFINRVTSRITSEEYQRRILAASRVYFVVGNRSDISNTRPEWLLLSFRLVAPGNPELIAAQQDAGKILSGPVYRVEACFVGYGETALDALPSPKGPRFQRIPLQRHQTLFVTSGGIFGLRRRASDPRWSAVPTE